MSVTNPDPPSSNWRVPVLSGERDLGPLENAYRRYTRDADVNQIIFIAWIYIVGLILYAFIDYQMFGPSPTLWILYTSRGAVLLFSLASMVILKRTASYQLMDWLVLIWTAAVAILAVYVHLTRPASLVPNALGDFIVVIGFYMILPNRFYFRILPALLLSLGDIVLLFYLPTGLSNADIRAILISLILGNFAGLAISVHLYTYRRNQYKAQHDEHEARLEIERLATIDSLTQILNRRRFMELATAEFQRFRRYKHVYSLLLFDLDHFKQINDTHGHLAGDAVLKEFAALISSQMRTNDSAGRLGGEEFAILFPETSTAEALQVAYRIREKCEALTVNTPDGPIQLTTSIGLTQVQVGDEANEDVYRRSDEALYQAKHNGRNRVELRITPTLDAATSL
jgi:diguanylate cyclase